jgi:hypothetical protein
VRSFVIVIILRVLLRYEEDEMGGVSSTNVKENKCILGFDRNTEGNKSLEDIFINESLIFK